MWHQLVLLILSLLSNNKVDCKPIVPCYFIFGDSLYDNGNNNNLDTLAKANYPPYGIDFPQGPTGRFTNGRNMADFVAEFLGFENYIPPFASAAGEEILQGVNYASGSAGIRDETGQHLGSRISLNNQLRNHEVTISRIETIQGQIATTDLLKKCIYSVGMGSNDYINNYLLPRSYNTSRIYTPEQYATVLIQQYSQQLRILYELGARKVTLFGLAPIGCTPASVASFGTDESLCVESVNNMVKLFNSKLKSLVDELNKDLIDAKFISINVYEISLLPLIGNRLLKIPPCCEVGENIKTTFQCIKNGKSCRLLRPVHLFWDATHPSEFANVVTAGRSHRSLLPSDTYPFDIYRLARL